MILKLKNRVKQNEVENLLHKLREIKLYPVQIKNKEKNIIVAAGLKESDEITKNDIIEEYINISRPYNLISREYKKDKSIINVGGVKIGGKNIVIFAGPCSVESEEHIIQNAKLVKKVGANILRGGAFKPRTSPYSFQGLEEEGLKHLKKAAKSVGIPIVTEVMDARYISLVEKYADILQVGSRNMHNYSLLKAVGKSKKPVLLKRGFAATLEEFLLSAEYIAAGGNENIILCERGIRTFSDYSRNTLDLNIVPVIQNLTHLPIIVDPSHGTGRRDLVIPLSKAAVAEGADGIMVEVHQNPENAASDKSQTIDFSELARLIRELKRVARAVGRKVQ